MERTFSRKVPLNEDKPGVSVGHQETITEEEIVRDEIVYRRRRN
jgi:hypothetical protein